MTIFTDGLRMGAERGITDYETSLGDTLKTSAALAVEDFPSYSLWKMGELLEAGGARPPAASSMAGLIDEPQTEASPRTDIPDLPIGDARQRVKDAGLEKGLQLPDAETIKEPVLQIMLDRARARRERETTIARGPDGFAAGALQVGTSFLTGVADPLNIAAAFIPIVGEARYAKMLANAGEGFLARTSVRARAGAIEGAAGTALLEPLVAGARLQEGQDYTFTEALKSVLFGAGAGAGLHSVFGGVRDIYRRRKGLALNPPADDAIAADATDRPEPPVDRYDPQTGEIFTEVPPPSPVVSAMTDLPPRAQEDLMRGAIASLVEGAPVRSGEMVEAAARVDPRIAESFERAPIRSIEIDVQTQLRAAGLNEQEAAVNAAIVAARYAARADRLEGRGGDALELYRGEGLQVRRGDARAEQPIEEIGRAFNQAARKSPQVRRLERSLKEIGPQIERLEKTAAETLEHRTSVMRRNRPELFDPEDPAAIAAALQEDARKTGWGPKLEQLRALRDVLERKIADAQSGGQRTFFQSGPDLFAQREADGQMTLPGAERIGEGELAQRRADAPLKPRVAQKAADEGLFGDDAAQKSFFQSDQAPRFYSAVDRAVTSAKIEKGSAEQWLGTIRNTAGVKAEEMEWLGLEAWLKEQDGSVTREQIQDYVRANAIEVREVTRHDLDVDRILEYHDISRETWDDMAPYERDDYLREFADGTGETVQGKPVRYGKYQLPGGENYRELLLTLPHGANEREGLEAFQARMIQRFGGLSEFWSTQAGTPEMAEWNRLTELAQKPVQSFQSSHWNEPNVVAHVRFNDRVIDGKKTLFVEEVQSDWHQAGKRSGYAGDPVVKSVEHRAQEDAEFPWAVVIDGQVRQRARTEEAAHMEAAELGSRGRVPDAPFKTTWPELIMKRMIRHAAENGYDKIAWTPGRVQAERYDLSKQIKAISASKTRGGTFHISGDGLDGRHHTIGTNIASDKLADYVGKDLAEKIARQDGTKIYSGIDLKVGGEGMSGFYDEILPKTVNKLVKKFGARVGAGEIDQGKLRFDVVDVTDDGDGRVIDTFANRDDAQGLVDLEDGGVEIREIAGGALKVHTLDITPELKAAAIEQGFPLFQADAAGGGPRGRINIAENRAIVSLFEKADPSTFMHESAHLWLEELMRDAGRADAPAALKKDFDTVLYWLGVEKADDIGVAQHETFARGFERYLAEGRAPTTALAAAFEQFKRWLQAIYRSLSELDVRINDDIRGVFDRMLATDADLAKMRDLPPLPDGVREVGFGPLGPELDGFQNRWPQAVDWLSRAQTGDARGVLSHPDVKEPIDVIWGDRNHGLDHIIHLHPEVVADLPERLGRMRLDHVTQPGEAGERLILRSDDGQETAVLRTSHDSGKKTWLLTAYTPESDRRRRGGDTTGSPPDNDPTRSSGPPADPNLGPDLGPDKAGPDDYAQPGAPRPEGENVIMGPRAAFGPRARDPETWSLFEFLAAKGGLRPGPEVNAILDGNRRVFGFGNLVRRTGMELDRAREAAVEAGYLSDTPFEGGVTRSTVNDLLRALDDESRGKKRYIEGREKAGEAFDPDENRAVIERAFDIEIEDAGIGQVDDKLRDRALQIMEKEGEQDPLVAFERAVMEDADSYERLHRARQDADIDIPGWDVPDDAGAAPQARGALPDTVIRLDTARAAGGAARGEASRPAGGGDRAQADADWRSFAGTGRAVDDPQAVARSRAADQLAEPESLSAEASTRVAAIARAAQEAEDVWKANEAYIPDDIKKTVERELAALDLAGNDRAEVIRRGAACLSAAVG